MKLQEHDIFTNFQFERERWQVRFELDYTAAVVLDLEVTDTLAGVVYSARYTKAKLAEREDLKKHFPALEELFYHLAHQSKTLIVSERAVEFQYKKERFVIELGKKEMGRDEANEVKIRLLEKRLDKELRQKDEEIRALRHELERLQTGGSGGKQQVIEPHPQNPDNTGFAYSEGADGLRVKRVFGNTWINFIASLQITEKITFKVRLIKLTGKSLCLGVGTKYMFGIHNYHEIEFMNFDFQGNEIAISGLKIKAPCQIQNGTVLTMRCDPKAYRMSWFYEGNEIGTVPFPEEVRGRTLYLIAYFKNPTDEIEIWTK